MEWRRGERRLFQSVSCRVAAAQRRRYSRRSTPALDVDIGVSALTIVPSTGAAVAVVVAALVNVFASIKGKVYGGKIRTPGVPGYAPGSVPPSTSGGAGEGEDSYKASVQRVALERFKAAMKE